MKIKTKNYIGLKLRNLIIIDVIPKRLSLEKNIFFSEKFIEKKIVVESLKIK